MVVGVLFAMVAGELLARAVMSQTTEAIRWYDATTQLKVEQMDALDGADVVFAGTSMAQQGFVPGVFDDVLGGTSWNAGLAGGTPDVMAPWLLDEVIPRLDPELVVWGLSSFDVAPAYGEQQAAVYSEALETRSGWLANADSIVSERSVLVRNRTVLRSLDALAGVAAEERSAAHTLAQEITAPTGERVEQTVDVSQDRGRIVQARLQRFTPDPSDVALIERTVLDLLDRGVEVVLVELPVPDRFRDAHPNGAADHALVGPALAGIAERSGVRFLRLLDGPTGPDFVDFTHLDAAAAAEFSRVAAAAVAGDRDDTMSTLEQAELLGIESVPAEPDAATTAEVVVADVDDCEPEIVVDDYGFEIDVANCGLTVPRLTDLDAASTRDVLADAFVFARNCEARGDPSLIGESVNRRVALELTRAIEQRNAAAAECASDDFPLLLSSAVSSLEAAADFSRPIIDPEDPLETTSRILAAIDHMKLDDTPEDGADNPPRSPWHSNEELRSLAEVRRLDEAGTPVGTVILGSSIGLQILDQNVLAEHFGEPVLNMSRPGVDPESWLQIYDRQFEERDVPSRVVWALTTHRLMATHPTPCGEPAASLNVQRSEWFRENMFPDLRAEHTTNELVFGSDLSTSPIQETRVFMRLPNGYTEPGMRILREDPLDEIPIAFRRRYHDGAEFCQSQIDDAAELVAKMTAQGTEVTVVMVPVHFTLYEISPDAHERTRAALAAAVTSAGADFLLVEEQLSDVETHDGWHATTLGRDRVTADLVELLGAAE